MLGEPFACDRFKGLRARLRFRFALVAGVYAVRNQGAQFVAFLPRAFQRNIGMGAE
jgi:hypothetical protein